MLKNKEERSRYLKDFDNWEIIQVIEEIGVTYFKLKDINNVVKRSFKTTWDNDYTKQSHETNEYYIYDESKRTLTKSCMTEVIETIKNINEQERLDCNNFDDEHQYDELMID